MSFRSFIIKSAIKVIFWKHFAKFTKKMEHGIFTLNDVDLTRQFYCKINTEMFDLEIHLN